MALYLIMGAMACSGSDNGNDDSVSDSDDHGEVRHDDHNEESHNKEGHDDHDENEEIIIDSESEPVNNYG